MGAVLLQSSYGSWKTWKGIKFLTFIFQTSNSVSVKEIADVKAGTKHDRDTNGAHYFLVHWVKPNWNLLVCSLETTHSIFFRFWLRYLIARPKSYQEITAPFEKWASRYQRFFPRAAECLPTIRPGHYADWTAAGHHTWKASNTYV